MGCVQFMCGWRIQDLDAVGIYGTCVCGGVSLILMFERTANTFPHIACYSWSG